MHTELIISELLPEQFVHTPPAYLVCPICQDIFEGPVLLKGCGHSFCILCLSRHLENEDRCPMCRNLCDESAGDPFIANISLKHAVDALLVRCPHGLQQDKGRTFQKVNGCQHMCKLENLASHQTNCFFAPANCQFSGCQEMLMKGTLSDHVLSCQFGPKNCVHPGCTGTASEGNGGARQGVFVQDGSMCLREETCAKILTGAPRAHPRRGYLRFPERPQRALQSNASQVRKQGLFFEAESLRIYWNSGG